MLRLRRGTLPLRGGKRPILDLRGLNKYLKMFPFKMLTTCSLLKRIREDTWFTSVDLRDAFFHISIYPPHRKFLRFCLAGQVYQYTVLLFGMSLSPCVFSRVTQAAVAPLRTQGVRLDTYLDDWLISADSAPGGRTHGDGCRSPRRPRVHPEPRKELFGPVPQDHLPGVRLDSSKLWARLSTEWTQTFRSCLASFQVGIEVPYLTCMRLAGFMASAIHLLRLGRFHMRPYQRWLNALRIPSTQRNCMGRVTTAYMRSLRP